MNKKLGELKVNKSDDYYDKIAQTLEEAGFVLVLELETISEKHYIIAEKVREISDTYKDKGYK